MPKRVLVIGLLFSLAGAAAIWETLAALLRSEYHLNLTVFLLPVGIGLLRCNKNSQWWAKIWIVLGYIVCGLMAAIGLLFFESARANLLGKEITGPAAGPIIIGVSLVIVALLVVIHRLISSERSNAYFNSREA